MSIKSVIIVGHGPELFNKGRGHTIDKFDVVVRMGNAYRFQDAVNYGTRTDYYVLPSTQFHKINDLSGMFKPTEELWLSHNMKKELKVPGGKGAERLVEEYKKYNPVVLTEAILFWFDFFKKYNHEDKKFSTGMVAIINVMHRLRPKTLLLPGFDNLRMGTNDNFQSGAVPGGREGLGQGHDYSAESKLLEDLSFVYDVAVV